MGQHTVRGATRTLILVIDPYSLLSKVLDRLAPLPRASGGDADVVKQARALQRLEAKRLLLKPRKSDAWHPRRDILNQRAVPLPL